MRRAGFTIVELIVAIALSSAAMLAIMAVFMPMVRTQLQSMNDMRSQGDAMSAHKGLLKSLRDASEVYSPAEGSSSNALSGAINYDTVLGGRIDDSRPATAFYYCVAANKKLYYHTASATTGSPWRTASPTCANGMMLAGNVEPASGQAFYFVRPAGRRGVVEVRYQVSYSTAQTASSTNVDAAVSFQSPSQAPTTSGGSGGTGVGTTASGAIGWAP